MIPSLRYLCLEKVIAQDEDYAGLPETLVKDINLMKIFNGTYVSGIWKVVKIFYDGKVWNFKSQNWFGEIDFSVKEGEAIQAESSLLNLLGISGLEQDDIKLFDWKFKADLQSNYIKDPLLAGAFGKVKLKSLGAIAFNGVGQGGSTVCGRFQVVVIDDPPVFDVEYLTPYVNGSVNKSVLYWKKVYE